MKKLLPKTVSNPQGFTLVELLVVVSIIAILSVVGITVFTSTQKGARDARRKSDIDAIAKALEVNYNNTTCGATSTAPYCPITATTQTSLFSAGVVPINPTPGGANYSGYPTTTPVASFTVKALLENGNGNCQTTVANDSYCRSNQQ